MWTVCKFHFASKFRFTLFTISISFLILVRVCVYVFFSCVRSNEFNFFYIFYLAQFDCRSRSNQFDSRDLRETHRNMGKKRHDRVKFHSKNRMRIYVLTYLSFNIKCNMIYVHYLFRKYCRFDVHFVDDGWISRMHSLCILYMVQRFFIFHSISLAPLVPCIASLFYSFWHSNRYFTCILHMPYPMNSLVGS